MNSSMYGNHENNSSDNEEPESLTCFDCHVNFTSDYYLCNHLLFHIKQPWVSLKRVQEPPIKITLKSRSDNSFEIISSPNSYTINSPKEENISDGLDNTEEEIVPELAEQAGKEGEEIQKEAEKELDEMQIGGETSDYEDGPAIVTFSPNFVGENGTISNDSNSPPASINEESKDSGNSTDYATIPGAEPTPPPEPPSPEYPKIRIKTGLLKESLTITEITDDNPNGDPRPEMIDLNSGSENSDSAYGSTDENNIWATPSLEDPLRLPESNDSDGSLISSLFNNNNDRAKDLGFTTSESEFISLDRFDDRNRGALQVYGSSASTSHSQSPLDTIAGLPMQQLAEQVSRLQPSSGMHQQNVLINIQQFQQPPPPPQTHSYQPPPPMYPHPPHPGVPPQPMYHQPYQYQPPNPMYYPPSHGYGAPMPPPHRAPMPQPQMPQPNSQQMGQPITSMAQPYTQSGPPRPQMSGPRQPMQPQTQRQPSPRQPMAVRQPMMPRQRAPMMRPRGGAPMGQRGPRPRMSPPNNMQSGQNQQPQRIIKRSPEQIQSLQAKRKRMDVLVPDKHDDADCEVIAVQPKNTGLPQIQSIQGNAPEPGDNSVMHLSDSITLSVRNPPARPPSPKKSDAKAVANILATRGITVTAAPKAKKADSPPPKKQSPPPVAINLNSAVSILPTNKSNNTNSKNAADSKLLTVDLTDDSIADTPPTSPQKSSPQKPTTPSQKVLPFQCDLCPAKYPNSISLSKHRQSFHKTGGLSEFGIPLIDLKQPGLVHRLTTFGIYNYIPLPGASTDTTFALPIISATNRNVATNFSNMGVSSILTLGPIRSLPKPVQNNTNNAK